MLSVATVVGCLLCGPLLDLLGRRKTLLIMNAPFIIGWIILCVTPSPAPLSVLYLGRILTGIGCGLVSSPGCVYIGEMSTDRLRGMLVTWPTVGMSIGVFLIYVIGLGIKDNWRLVAGISISVPTIATILVFIFLKESPMWLLSRGRIQEAEVSFKWIRQIPESQKMPSGIHDEFQSLVEATNKTRKSQVPSISTIENNLEGRSARESSEQTLGEKIAKFFREFKAPEFWKPLVIHNLFFFFMQFGGVQVVQAYATDILQSAGVKMEAYTASVLLGAMQLVGGLGASFAFNK